MENPLVFFDYLEPPYRDRLSSQTDRYGQQRLVIHDFNPRTGRNDLERVFPQPDGAGKGAFSAIHPETAIGSIFNRIRIEHMDREGIDGQVLYGSMTLSFEAILDRDLAVACMRAYNDYIAEDCRAYPRRLFPVAYLSLVDIAEAVAELRRASHAASKGNRADRRRRRLSRAPPRGGWEPKAAAARLRQAAIAAGRDPATLSITVFNAPADQAALAPYREAGIARVLLEVPDASRDEVLRRLDKSAPLAADNR